MARSIPPALKTVLEGSPLAGECLILRALDGTLAGFTTLVRAQVVDLTADGGPGPVTCDNGMVLSESTLAVGLEASFCEAYGPLGPVLTRAAVDGGRWTDAEAWLVRIAPGTAGYAPLLAGKVREARCEDPRWVLEIRNQADALNQTMEEKILGYCRFRYGGAECGHTPEEITATVTAVTDALRFSVGFTGTYADDHFNLGEVEFTSGVNDGVISEKLFDWISGGANLGALVLRVPLPATPAVGDTLLIRDGCELTRAACIAHQGDAVRFGGFPDVPGSDQVLQYPNPGS